MANSGAKFLDDAGTLVAEDLIGLAVVLVSPAKTTMGDLDEDLIAIERRRMGC